MTMSCMASAFLLVELSYYNPLISFRFFQSVKPGENPILSMAHSVGPDPTFRG
jgi:hypothetical protein